jgi:hypothetical protein
MHAGRHRLLTKRKPRSPHSPQFGFTPPRAEKSKRLEGSLFQLTVSRGLTTEVERIRHFW